MSNNIIICADSCDEMVGGLQHAAAARERMANNWRRVPARGRLPLSGGGGAVCPVRSGYRLGVEEALRGRPANASRVRDALRPRARVRDDL